MDFRGFKKISEDAKTTILRHEKGHEIRVVHAALDRKMRSALKRMPSHAEGQPEGHEESKPGYAAGGPVVKDPTEGLTDQQSSTPAPVTINIGTPSAAQAAPAPATPEASAPPEPTTAQRIGQALGQGLRMTPIGMGAQAAGLLQEGAKAAAPYANQLAEGLGAGASGNPIPAPAAAAQPSLAPSQPAPSSLAPDSTSAPAVPTPATPALPSPAEMAEGNYQKALGLGMRGIQEQAAAESQLGAERAKILDQAAQGSIKLEDEFRKNLADNAARIDTITQEIRDNKIRPSAYLESMGTGDKIGTAIGLILGGIGGGLTHQENPVLKMLNMQIERDLDAQRKNLDQKNNLLSTLMKEKDDIRAAADSFRLIRANTIAQQLDRAAASAATPQAKARADQAKAALLQQYAPVLMKSSLMSTVSKIAKSGDPDAVGKILPQLRTYAPEMAKEMESRYVPGVGMASIPLDAKQRETLEARNGLQEQVHRLREFARQHEGTVLDRATVNYGLSLTKTVQDAYRRANGQGVFKESEAEFVNSIIGDDPTAFFNKFRVDPKLRALEDSNRAELNSLRKSVGLPQSQAPAEIKIMNGVRYLKVPGGYRRIK